MESGDIDLDMPDRNLLLAVIPHIPAVIIKDDQIKRHPSGVYVTQIPHNPITGLATMDYKIAEGLGYQKIDFLNVHLYQKIRDEAHLLDLMATEPLWELLQAREFCERLMHLNNSYDLLQRLPEPITSIEQLAMFLAVIRPSKRHLANKSWLEIAKNVWDRDEDGYVFRKSHAVAYAHLVAVNMLLLQQEIIAESSLPEQSVCA
jgi:hypothetical protein